MRILHTLFLLVSFSFFANAEKKSIVLEDGTRCQYEIKQGVLAGEYRSYYANGKLKSEGTFTDNNRLGFWVFYSAEGKVTSMRDYKNNFSYEEKTPDSKAKTVALTETNNVATDIYRKALTENQLILYVEQENSSITGVRSNK